MQKKKKRYMLGILLATLLLVADIIVFAVSKPSTADFGGNMPSFENGEMPQMPGESGEEDSTAVDDSENTDKSSNDSAATEGTDGSATEDFSDSTASGNFGRGGKGGRGNGSASGERPQMPSGSESGEMPQMPSGSESGEMPQMPGGSESGEMPAGLELQAASTGLSTVQKVCIPVGVLCILVDLFCVIGLFKIRKAEKTMLVEDGILLLEDGTVLTDGTEGASENGQNSQADDGKNKAIPAEPLDPAEERLKKKKRNKKRLTAFLAILLVVVLVLQVWSTGISQGSSSSVEEEVITAKVESGSMDQTLKSSGILASAKDEAVAIPGDITVTSYFVSNGDTVAEGDPIAIVEKNSVMAAIADVQELIDELDEEMSDVKDDSISSTIKASVDGTVVAVYASSGKSVVDVMYNKGALILISLDELLAVKIDNPGDLTVGDELTVTDEDGNAYTGQVSAIEKDTVVVTVSLDDFSYKEKVTVTDSESNKLGSGKLYIYSQQKITGYSGTISSVSVSKGETISAGDTLLTLSDTDYTAAYQALLSKRMVLEDQYNELVEIGSSGYVYAKEAGTISGVDESLLAASTGDSSTDKAVATTKNDVNVAAVQTSGMVGSTTAKSSVSGFMNVSTTSTTSTEAATTSTEATASNEATTEAATTDESTETVPTETVSRSVNMVWMNADGSVMIEGLPENVIVQLWANEEKADEQVLSATNNWKYTWSELSKYAADGSEISYTVKLVDSVTGYTTASQVSESVTLIINTKQSDTPGTSVGENVNGNGTTQMPQTGDSDSSKNNTNMPANGNGTNANGTKGNSGTDATMGGTGTGANMGGTSGGTVTGITGSGTAASETTVQEEDTTYVFEETEICSLSPNDTVEVDITVDELDINSVKTGQECTLTLDAFPSQSFTGTVKYIDKSGTNSGGNTKYTVTVSMDKEEDMLLGMNASVQIVLSTQSNILVIPEAALVEQGDSVYVYTEYDKKSDELGGLIEVTTGMSDGQNVEIVEGLEEEQEFYYRYAGTISYTFVEE